MHALTGETRQHGETTVHRIFAQEDIPGLGVERGQEGGWVECLENIEPGGWALDDATIFEHARLGAGCTARNHATARGRSRIESDSHLSGEAHLSGAALIAHSRLTGRSKVGQMAFVLRSTVEDRAEVSGSAYLVDSMATDLSTLQGEAHVEGSVLRDSSHVGGFAQVTNARIGMNTRIDGHAAIGVPYGPILALEDDASLQLGGRAVIRDASDAVVLSGKHELDNDDVVIIHATPDGAVIVSRSLSIPLSNPAQYPDALYRSCRRHGMSWSASRRERALALRSVEAIAPVFQRIHDRALARGRALPVSASKKDLLVRVDAVRATAQAVQEAEGQSAPGKV